MNSVHGNVSHYSGTSHHFRLKVGGISFNALMSHNSKFDIGPESHTGLIVQVLWKSLFLSKIYLKLICILNIYKAKKK